MKRGPKPTPLALRFWRHVRVNVGGCWEWQASLCQGYGQFGHGIRGVSQRAHRWLYEQLFGPVQDGLDLDHLCRNRRCVNPLHLEPVTRQENLRRGVGGFRRAVA